MMGLNVCSTIMSWNVMFIADSCGDSCIVLILAPFVVFKNVQLLTITFLTSFSSGYLPRLPILHAIEIKIVREVVTSIYILRLLTNKLAV